jgi:hypothetical protein
VHETVESSDAGLPVGGLIAARCQPDAAAGPANATPPDRHAAAIPAAHNSRIEALNGDPRMIHPVKIAAQPVRWLLADNASFVARADPTVPASPPGVYGSADARCFFGSRAGGRADSAGHGCGDDQRITSAHRHKIQDSAGADRRRASGYLLGSAAARRVSTADSCVF